MDEDCPRRRYLAWRHLLPWLVGGLALLLYVLTAAPWLSWAHEGADGGDLIAASMTQGVPHPSGYPTYCLLGRLFALLPLGSIARRFNLFSATAAAVSIGLLVASLHHTLSSPTRRLTRPQAAVALVSGLAWAVSPTLWSQATIAEVYALAILFTTLCLSLCLREDLLRHLHAWALLGFALGLGLGAHLTVGLMIPSLIILLWKQRTWRRAITLGAAAGAGALVYVYLPLAALAKPLVNWGDPRTWDRFWWVVSGAPYRDYLFAFPHKLLVPRITAWLQLWAQQFTWLGLALAALGLWSWIEERRRSWAAATIVLFVVSSLVSLGYDTTDSYLYLLPGYLVTTLWLAEGARTLLEELTSPAKRFHSIVLICYLLALGVIPAWSVWHNLSEMDLRHDEEARRWASGVLAEAREDALLLTGQDRHTFTLDYVLWVEGQRRDLIVIDGELWSHAWYKDQLARRYPGLTFAHEDLAQLVRREMARRPIYLASPRPDLERRWHSEARGPLWLLSDVR